MDKGDRLMIEVVAYTNETGAVFKDDELVFNNSGHADKHVINPYMQGALVVDSVEVYLSSDNYKDNEVTKWIKENL